jgi:hypothetical protein
MLWGDKTWIPQAIKAAREDYGAPVVITEVGVLADVLHVTFKSADGVVLAKYTAHEDGSASRVGP